MKTFFLSFLWFSLLFAATAQASQALIEFQSPEQQALFKELTQELRCPKCQNQNIADSNAVVAVDMRNKTLELVQQGQDKEQVLDYMKSRYGDFVHYQPPLNKFTLILWLLPALMAFGLVLVLLLRRRAERSGAVTESAEQAVPQPQLEQQLDQLIEQYRRKS
ncbi:MAG: cytochrome c-type biogenesis protein CcmH [Gammaproteobacteria bacterium]|nr:cytochrome c-type biogenesis protein CcmH [Gammaproteobacteria bacterium]MBU2058523.1 cytochrome c-type biogenesis protein CcmH [Gammaproteobacteria bacterium]MBU2175548.1 cytochrome c-type biogenesis protein CcmH [Gammaproteobacteria bacterium]MBU2248634.1 cytochrome c-type biogenesis protein CcmH [Gammaproteobacteria bacterium]MBU2343078.1 cytochrome c-type biogenesis protein CcmH [Gammaproteobacteria bacterium]